MHKNIPVPTESRQVLVYLFEQKDEKGAVYGAISMQLGLDSAASAEGHCKPLLAYGLAEFHENRVRITQIGRDWMKWFLHIQEERILESIFLDYNFTLLRFLYDESRAIKIEEFPSVLISHAPKKTKGYDTMNFYHMLKIELKPFLEVKENKYQLNNSGRKFVEAKAKELNVSLYSNTQRTVNIDLEMNLKQEKNLRDQFLRTVYAVARQESPASPTSVQFGLSKYTKFNLGTQQRIENGDESGGYAIGASLGLSKEQVDSFVSYLCGSSLGYLGSYIGMGQFYITQEGIMYLESLEESSAMLPIHNHFNSISLGDINSPVQVLQGATHSTQHLAIEQSSEQILSFLSILEENLNLLKEDIRSDFQLEIDYARKQIQRSRSVKQQLENIGRLMKDVGINVFANILASPIYETIKPMLF